MKRSLKTKYHLLITLFFLLIVIEAAFILMTSFRLQDIKQLKGDIQSIVVLFIFIQFIYFILIYYYIPLQYKRSLHEIAQIIEEISQGNYKIDFELKSYYQDEEIKQLLKDINKMLNIIQRFDELKADKILEHHQRIQTLIRLIPQGCIIVSNVGELVYSNDRIKYLFPFLSDSLNLIESFLPEPFESAIKPHIIACIKEGSNETDIKTKPINGKSYLLSSYIIRNRNGQPTGAIFRIDIA